MGPKAVGAFISLGILSALSVPSVLTSLADDRLSSRPEFTHIWGLNVVGQLLIWALAILVNAKYIKESLKKRTFCCYAGAYLLVVFVGSIYLMWRPDLLPRDWQLDFVAVMGRPAVIFTTVVCVVGAAVSSSIVGVAGAQLTELWQPIGHKTGLKRLVAIQERVWRSFACLSVLLTLSVFSTARLMEAFEAANHPAPAALTLNFGVFMSLLLVVFYAPVALAYYQEAQKLLQGPSVSEPAVEPSQDALTDLQRESQVLEKQESLRKALGLTSASGLEGLIGTMVPALGAALSLAAGK